MARKSWSELSPAYQKRLRNKGIGPREHASGASIRAARGHVATPEHNIWRKKALAWDIKTVIPGYDSLPAAEAEKVGRDWVLGFMTKSKGKLEPIRIFDHRYGKKGFEKGTKLRYQTDEQKNAHIEFLSWTDNKANQVYMHPPGGGDTDWQAYRDAYQQKFSKG
jgi:hypothetical protein